MTGAGVPGPYTIGVSREAATVLRASKIGLPFGVVPIAPHGPEYVGTVAGVTIREAR